MKASKAAVRRNPRIRGQAFQQFTLDWLRDVRPAASTAELISAFSAATGCEPLSQPKAKTLLDRMFLEGRLASPGNNCWSHPMRAPDEVSVLRAAHPKAFAVFEILQDRYRGRTAKLDDLVHRSRMPRQALYKALSHLLDSGLVRWRKRVGVELSRRGEDLQLFM